MIRKATQLMMTVMLAIAGCNGPRDVTVEVWAPDLDDQLDPVPGLPLVILPYDRDSVLALLESEALQPRPHVAVLDSLFAAFRIPYRTFRFAAVQVERYRDTLNALKTAMDTLLRGDEAYRERFQLFAQLSDSLELAQGRRDKALTGLEQARRSFVPLSDSLRQEVRLWEAETFAGYDTMVTNLAEDTGRVGLVDTTDMSGRSTINVGRGSWWVYARAWDVADPNSEWYWNVPLSGDTVRLDERNGTRLPTY